MALSVSCTCCALVRASAECCGYLCYPSAVIRLWSMWSNSVPLSLIWCTCVVPLFLRCYVIHHMVLIAQCGKVLRLPLRSYRLYNRISQFWFDFGFWWNGSARLFIWPSGFFCFGWPPCFWFGTWWILRGHRWWRARLRSWSRVRWPMVIIAIGRWGDD